MKEVITVGNMRESDAHTIAQYVPSKVLMYRAAMGVSQETDAMAIIVSEETGNISIAYQGRFYLRLTAEELERKLTEGAK